jgi:hypothetical protein
MTPVAPREKARMRLGDGVLVGVALLAGATSAYLWFGGQREEGLFVGLWVPSILAFGAFVKLAIRS